MERRDGESISRVRWWLLLSDLDFVFPEQFVRIEVSFNGFLIVDGDGHEGKIGCLALQEHVGDDLEHASLGMQHLSASAACSFHIEFQRLAVAQERADVQSEDRQVEVPVDAGGAVQEGPADEKGSGMAEDPSHKQDAKEVLPRGDVRQRQTGVKANVRDDQEINVGTMGRDVHQTLLRVRLGQRLQTLQSGWEIDSNIHSRQNRASSEHRPERETGNISIFDAVRL